MTAPVHPADAMVRMPALLSTALAERTHTSLFDASAESRMAAALAPLPAACSRFFGFEVPLDRPATGADVLVCTRAGEERDALALALRSPPPGAAWTRLADFVRSWSDRATPWASAVHNIWTEFDTAAPAPEPPQPSVFFGVRRGGGADLPGIVSALTGTPLGRESTGRLAACTAAAAAYGAEPFQVGAMLSRALPAIRLCLRGAMPGDLPALLSACGHAIDRAALEEVLAVHGPPVAARVDVGLDLLPDGMLGPRLGLELPPPATRSGLVAQLDALEADGLARSDRVRPLLETFGITHERRHREIWPAYLARLARRAGADVHGLVHRRLNHLKITLAPDMSPGLKAYVAAEVLLVSDSALKEGLVHAGMLE